ncbi:MAG: BMP family ABC transporter substrate-binding protein [Clostridia bacterium]|nr:BMP family ABC transporter substrate-binding protein [Clostridia bacterium]
MKRYISALLAVMLTVSMLFAFGGCGKNNYDLVLITDSGQVTDRGYNQSVWEGMCAYCVEKNIDCRYFVPSGSDTESLLVSLRGAADDGAKTIVAAGSCFEEAVLIAAKEYPDVKFILLDGKPKDRNTPFPMIPVNLASVTFSSEQSGYLAGYAAVSDGFTKIGVMYGLPTDDISAYTYGFLQGAENAAALLGAGVEVTYHCTGDTLENDANEQTATLMYAGGTELIFACGGALEKSVIKAAEKEKGYVIGSDTDKRYDSSYVVTTAYKDLSQAVVRVLRSIYDTKDFESGFGGKTTMFGAAENCTGLPKSVFNDSNGDPFDRFMRFTKSAYDAEFSKVADGTVQIKRTVTVAEDNVYPTEQELTSGLGLFNVHVIVMQ